MKRSCMDGLTYHDICVDGWMTQIFQRHHVTKTNQNGGQTFKTLEDAAYFKRLGEYSQLFCVSLLRK